MFDKALSHLIGIGLVFNCSSDALCRRPPSLDLWPKISWFFLFLKEFMHTRLWFLRKQHPSVGNTHNPFKSKRLGAVSVLTSQSGITNVERRRDRSLNKVCVLSSARNIARTQSLSPSRDDGWISGIPQPVLTSSPKTDDEFESECFV